MPQNQTPPQLPPLFDDTPSSILSDAKTLIQQIRAAYDSIARRSDSPTFDTVVRPFAEAENNYLAKSLHLKFYKHVSPNGEIRNASLQAQTLLDDFEIETRMREDLYHLVSAVARSEDTYIDDEDRFFLRKLAREYVRNGLTLAEEDKKRFTEIKKRLSVLCMQFRRNIVEDKERVWFTREELVGVSEDFVSKLEEQGGRFKVMLNPAHQGPVMQDARDPETRKRMFLAMQSRCPENVDIFREVMLLRDEAARLLGYADHATYRLEAKMAKDPEVVNRFLAEIEEKLIPYARNELDALKEIKKADLEAQGITFDGYLFMWDYGYYQKMWMRDQHSVDKDAIKQYFPLEIVIDQMLSIFGRLFNLQFVENIGVDGLAQNDMRWHEDVRLFSVWDTDTSESHFLGYLYLDIFYREGKTQNPSSHGFVPGFIREDGSRQYPSTAFLCSFDKSSPGKASCVGHFELTVSLFHELGHAIHDLVAKMNDQGTESPLLLYFPDYLKAWKEQAEGKPQPPKEMPDDVLAKLIALKNATNSNMWLISTAYSIFDMKIHQPASHNELEKMDITAEYCKIRKRVLGRDGPEVCSQGYAWGHGYTSWGHLMGDYDAGFYGYLYSKVFADDMFHSVFAVNPMNSAQSMRYRHAVLEKGGRQDEMETLVEFLGREPNAKAFYKELGLS